MTGVSSIPVWMRPLSSNVIIPYSYLRIKQKWQNLRRMTTSKNIWWKIWSSLKNYCRNSSNIEQCFDNAKCPGRFGHEVSKRARLHTWTSRIFPGTGCQSLESTGLNWSFKRVQGAAIIPIQAAIAARFVELRLRRETPTKWEKAWALHETEFIRFEG